MVANGKYSHGISCTGRTPIYDASISLIHLGVVAPKNSGQLPSARRKSFSPASQGFVVSEGVYEKSYPGRREAAKSRWVEVCLAGSCQGFC